jgi:4-alpha-glucanotransferase
MKILEFAFGDRDSEEINDFLPFMYPHNCVVYTGTHDNSTVKGWLKTLDKETYRYVADYVSANRFSLNSVVDGVVRSALSSPADLAVIPMQDYLRLDDSARINIPSTLGNNWIWRMRESAMNSMLSERIAKETTLYRR